MNRYPVILLNRQFHRDGEKQCPYGKAVLDHGGIPVPVPCLFEEGRIASYLGLADGVILTGGPDYPPEWYGERRDGSGKKVTAGRAVRDRILARLAFASDKPVLGICAGHQLANIHFGGALIQDISSPVTHRAKGGARHEIDIVPGTLAARIFGAGRLTVNSGHHQAADPDRLGEGLVISARSVEDGIVEALEPAEPGGLFRLFLQWHPEQDDDPAHRRLIFEPFIAACRGDWR